MAADTMDIDSPPVVSTKRLEGSLVAQRVPLPVPNHLTAISELDRNGARYMGKATDCISVYTSPQKPSPSLEVTLAYFRPAPPSYTSVGTGLEAYTNKPW